MEENRKLVIASLVVILSGNAGNIADTLKTNEIVLIIDEGGLFILSTSKEELTAKLMEKMRDLGIKGGGKGKSIMGKLGNVTTLEVKNFLKGLLID